MSSKVIFSMAKSFILSVSNSKKIQSEQNLRFHKISRQDNLSFSNKKLNLFNNLVNWQGKDIHPTFPYILATHLHFSLVNDETFPFSPYGLIHKCERISQFRPLIVGDWKMKCRIDGYRELSNGIEFDIQSDLYINNEWCWRSVTTAFKRLTTSVKKHRPDIPIQEGAEIIQISNKIAREYALLSMNIDFIHLFNMTAKIMGHQAAVMHGMWGLSRAISASPPPAGPVQIECHFKAPMYLPCKIFIKTNREGASTHFGIYSAQNGHPHLVGSMSCPS